LTYLLHWGRGAGPEKGEKKEGSPHEEHKNYGRGEDLYLRSIKGGRGLEFWEGIKRGKIFTKNISLPKGYPPHLSGGGRLMWSNGYGQGRGAGGKMSVRFGYKRV